MKCPSCVVPLETQKIGTVNYDICHSCLGVWLPSHAVKGILAARAQSPEQFMNQLLTSILRLESDSYTDKLTGLRNRRFFDRQLYSEIGRARGSHYVSLILMDLDGFKTANDTYGHSTGDLILRDFSNILMRLIRRSDHAARVGGDEFGMIMPETDTVGARAIAERVVRETASHQFVSIDGRKLTGLIRVSAGVGTYPTDLGGEIVLDELDALQHRFFNLTDAALYEAKSQGKGRTVAVGELGPESSNGGGATKK